MPQNQIKWIKRLPPQKVTILALLFLMGNTVLAQSSSNTVQSTSNFSAVEIIGLIAGIVAIVLIAWFMVGRQTSDDPHINPNAPRKHYDHPNDPHFRKLKKKTS